MAARLGAGCVTDANGLSEQGWVRSVYGGSLLETVAVEGHGCGDGPFRSFGKPEREEGRTAPVQEETVAIPEVQAR